MNRKPIFDAVRTMLGHGFCPAQVAALDAACDKAEAALPAGDKPGPAPGEERAPTSTWRLGAAGAALIKHWEGCAARQPDGTFKAYPDPGSADGLPWTIGWGSTGPGISRETAWTQAQCDAAFETGIRQCVDQVAMALGGAPTTQNQFDALVAFHYNTGRIASATLTFLHRQGKFAEARAEFAKWIYNSHMPLKGLRNRRAAEAALYAARDP